MGYNNFKFINTNTVYGDRLNQPIAINVMYTNNMTAHLTTAQRQGIAVELGSALQVVQVLGDLIQRCTANTDQLIAELTRSDVNSKITDNVAALTTGKKDKADFKPVIDFGDPAYSCRPIFPPTSVEVTETVTFVTYHPVIYIDPFGFSSFNYKLTRIKDKNDEQGTPIRYCQGNKYTGKIYTLGEKPKCPDSKQNQKSAEHKVGLVTMYKTNIVTVRHPVHMCAETNTHINSGMRAFGSQYDNRPLKGKHIVPDEETCRKWVTTKQTFCCGHLRKMGGVVGDLYSSNNDKNFRYPFWGSYTNDVKDGFLTNSVMDIEMPSLKIKTPFWDVPSRFLYEKTHSPDQRGRIVWTPFKHPDICLHVPFASGKTQSIKFHHDPKATQHSPKSEYVRYFVSDALSLMESVDSTQKVADPKFNCIPYNKETDEIYVTKSGYVIKFTEIADEKLDDDELTEYPHSSFSKMKVSPDMKVVSSKLANSHPAHFATTHNRQSSTQPAIDSKLVHVRTQVQDNSTDLLFAAITGAPTKSEVLAYNQYTMTQKANENLRRQALQTCKSRQNEYELFAMSVSVNPTRAIVLKTKAAIQAVHAGPGFYSVKECDYIEDIRVIPTLRTNSSMSLKLNGRMVPFTNMTREMGVIPAEEKCFSGVLIIFKLTDLAGDDELFGQIGEEGIITTGSAPLLEECQSKMQGESIKIFHIHNVDHIFIDYKHAYSVAHDQLIEPAEQAVKRTQDTLAASKVAVSSNSQFEKLEEIKQNIHLIWSDDDSLSQEAYSYTPVGLKGDDLYSIPEKQSLALSLSELIAAKSNQDLARRRYTAQVYFDYTGNSSTGGGGDGFISTLADGLATVIDAGASGITKIIGGGADAVSELADTAVSESGSFMSSIGDFFSGTLGEILIPIVIIIVVVIIGYMLYKKWLMGGFDNDDKMK